MKVNIYDRVAWPGFMQWCLKTSWLLGCVFQKLIGVIDDYYGAESWEDAMAWVKKLPEPIEQLQYWGHGSPGVIWLAGNAVPTKNWLQLKPYLSGSDALIWFRVCSSFQGKEGHAFSKAVADGLNCTAAGHLWTIGLWQPGLFTRQPFTKPTWPVDEGAVEPKWRPDLQPWLIRRTIICLRWWIPKGW